jgi:hypothetical protein
MPERLNRVEVATRYGTVEIPWTARDAILDELRGLENARSTVEAFDAVGASWPVNLDRQGKLAVLDAIQTIAKRVPEGYGRLDPQLAHLRHSLVDELDARE